MDRCGDVFKHANHAGTSKHGGVLVLAGDDHGAKSSTLPHQSDHMFSAAMLPVLYPSSVQEILDLGLHGWAMSRYSGVWVGFKCVADTVESSSSVYIDPERTKILVPDDFPLPPDGLSIRWPDGFLETEARMQNYKIYAALHYCRVNQLNRIVIDSPKPRLGIITSGKSYLDVRQALDDLGITEQDAAEIGIRVYKVAMPWPLEPEGVRHFAEGLEEILVVEERKSRRPGAPPAIEQCNPGERRQHDEHGRRQRPRAVTTVGNQHWLRKRRRFGSQHRCCNYRLQNRLHPPAPFAPPALLSRWG